MSDLNDPNNQNTNSNNDVIYPDNSGANPWDNFKKDKSSENPSPSSASSWGNLKPQISDNTQAQTEIKPDNQAQTEITPLPETQTTLDGNEISPDIAEPASPPTNQPLSSLLQQDLGQPDLGQSSLDNSSTSSIPAPEFDQPQQTFVDPNHTGTTPELNTSANITPDSTLGSAPATNIQTPSFYNPNAMDAESAATMQPQNPDNIGQEINSPPQFVDNNSNLESSANNIDNGDSSPPPPSPPPPPPEFATANNESVPPPMNNSNQSESDENLMIASLNKAHKLSSLKNYIFIAIGLIVVVGIIVLVLSFLNKQRENTKDTETAVSNKQEKTHVSEKKTELVYWGLWEPKSIMQPIIDDYQKSHPDIQINYQMQSHKDYRTRLQAKLKSSDGPDIFRYHNTWLPMLKNNLARDDQNLINISDYYPVVAKDVTLAGKIYGVPLEFDSLALYYNPRILTNAGVKVPTTWAEVKDVAEKVVSTDENGKITVGGIAMGTANNVDHFSDIIGLLMLQNGANLANIAQVDENNQSLGEDALNFYTLFARDATTWKKVWDDTMPNSTYAFATEKVAMMFAPSWRAFQIKEINPDLKFAVTMAPQLPGDKQAWATYWVEGVSKNSKHSQEAWQFLSYLSQPDTLKKLYTAESTYRQMFGEPYPLKSMAGEISDNSLVGAFVKQGPYAKSWYLSSNTDDSGINDRMIKYYEDAINALNQNKQMTEVMPTLSKGISQVLGEFGLSSATNTTHSSNPAANYPVEPVSTSSSNDGQI